MVYVAETVARLVARGAYYPLTAREATTKGLGFDGMTCRVARRVAGVLAGVLWLAAGVLVVWEPGQHPGLTLMMVGAAASGTVIGAVGFMLSKGSAEAVYQMGFRAGKAAQLHECAGRAADGSGGTVLALPLRR